MTDVYEKLAQHLDNLPAGFPRTDSGVEMRILKRLFSPVEADVATKLTMMSRRCADEVLFISKLFQWRMKSNSNPAIS